MGFIDFHCDTASLIYEREQKLYSNPGHIDIGKMKQANYLAQWFAFFVHLSSLNKDNGETAFSRFNKMYDYFIEQVALNDDIEIVSSYEQYQNAKANEKISAFLSIEEGEVVGGGLPYIDKLEDMGITLMTLTWNFANSLAYPHSVPRKSLTPYGKEVVSYLNNKKILVDVAHLSDKGIDEVLRISKKPVIASHSNARTYKQHSRNLCDKHIKGIATTGGVIGLNFYNDFLGYSNPPSCMSNSLANTSSPTFGNSLTPPNIKSKLNCATIVIPLRPPSYLIYIGFVNAIF